MTTKPAIPRAVDILGIRYKVRVVNRAEDIAGAEGMDRVGHCDPVICEIVILNRRNRKLNLQTFFHEVIHAYSYALGYGLEFDDTTEGLVDRIASLAVEFLTRNKML